MSKALGNSAPPVDFANLAAGWRADGITRLLSYVWSGFDALRAENPPTLNRHDEVSINSHLESCIQRMKPKRCPFDIQHTPPEVAARLTKSRPAPCPDFGFFPWSDRRAMLPLEAKVLKGEGDLSEYLKALRTRFLQCRYAPYSSEGAMIGYLLAGEAAVTFKKLGRTLRTQLVQYSDFPARTHRVSAHQRKHRSCKASPAHFRCHHMIMLMG